MSKHEGIPGSQSNNIRGTGNIITGGTFTDSQVSATTVNAPQNPLIRQLQDELARMRECLAGVRAPAEDHEDAMEALVELQDEVAQDPDPDQGGLRRLRKRVRQLIGVLTPVAEVVGGVAALEEICRHL
jgi:Family of unknown function (DUF5955)